MAIRRAGASFQSRFDLRSPLFRRALERIRTSSRALQVCQDALVDALYAFVPAAPSDDARHAAIQAKRAVFNGRRVRPDVLPRLPSPLRRAVVRYHRRRTVARRATAPPAFAACIRDMRTRLATLWNDPLFRAAVRYASPDLHEACTHTDAEAPDRFSKSERGLYGYAAKFISKANPFHTFASVAFPHNLGLPTPPQSEVVLNTALVSYLDTRVLSSLQVLPGSARMHLSRYVTRPETVTFFVRADDALNRVTVPRKPVVDVLLDFDRSVPDTEVPTVERFRAYVSRTADSTVQARMPTLLLRLRRAGILVMSLLRTPERFADDLLPHADEDLEPVLRALQSLQHAPARLPAEGTPSVHDEVPSVEAVHRTVMHVPVPRFEAPSSRFYVNRYDASPDPVLSGPVADEVMRDLRAVKPLLSTHPSFHAHDHFLRGFVRSVCRERGKTEVPYLDVLDRYLDDPAGHAEAHRVFGDDPAEGEALQRFLDDASARTGTLTEADLAALCEAAPLPPDRAAEPMCINGPVDVAAGRFYPWNLWAGHGRFLHRYHLTAQRRPYADPLFADPNVTHVQLAPPFFFNRNYVPTLCRTGIGFDGRHRERFARWIDPADVHVGLSGATVHYRHAHTGERLRFHHVGFLLGRMLAPEYRMLLYGHRDVYTHLFTQYTRPDGEVEHTPGLRYGRLQLRRDRWVAPLDTMPPLDGAAAGDASLLRYAARLRAWMAEHLRPGTRWYYRLDLGDRGEDGLGSDPYAHKPVYLDLFSPLSVQRFARDAARIGRNGAVSLEPMAPAPATLPLVNGQPVFTELMIEV